MDLRNNTQMITAADRVDKEHNSELNKPFFLNSAFFLA